MENLKSSLRSLAHTVADKVSAMLAYWDNQQVCRFANDAYLHWFNASFAEMINKMTLKELLGPLYELNRPYIEAALQGREQTFEQEITLPNGTKRQVLASYYPDIQDGQVKGFFAHVADITPTKLLEQELRRSNDIIKRQNQRLMNFANTVSHNLSSYSANFSSIIELFVTAKTEEQRTQMCNYMKHISRDFCRTVEHLNEIVRFSDVDEYPTVVVNLREYFSRSLDILRLQIEAAGATVKNEIDAGINVRVIPAYLESIILNLITNAIKYRHTDRALLIDLQSVYRSGMPGFMVKDNGRGIDINRHREKLFGLYKTFHGNPDAKGVGLFITKYQVESMGGRIDVESAVDNGATFHVLLPSDN
jgi:PAS domain S-box-containing protein